MSETGRVESLMLGGGNEVSETLPYHSVVVVAYLLATGNRCPVGLDRGETVIDHFTPHEPLNIHPAQSWHQGALPQS